MSETQTIDDKETIKRKREAISKLAMQLVTETERLCEDSGLNEDEARCAVAISVELKNRRALFG